MYLFREKNIVLTKIVYKKKLTNIRIKMLTKFEYMHISENTMHTVWER